ncbi:flagellar basal body L-ring protein FlgH [uncultured Sphingomonas sp.]|uniref:flagellar basal body L-ring protein FlgH n=1 Tax=uncultured Sphingomonas sp. TaxID=158754 RepID=UPI0025DE7AEE|nr:flagellar basal body L-ring protein FlgH [uncultured Sphingomonas sp.]
MSIVIVAAVLAAVPDDLYRRGNWAALAADRRASEIGDALIVTIFQAAESSRTAQNLSRKATDASAGLRAGGIAEGGTASFGGGFTGRGESRRSERLVAQLSVTVTGILPNGDLLVAGRQRMRVNGEQTDIGVRGRIRTIDIAPDNSVLSTRIADAEIDYGGRGFVSRSARPGIINRLFGLLGLG